MHHRHRSTPSANRRSPRARRRAERRRRMRRTLLTAAACAAGAAAGLAALLAPQDAPSAGSAAALRPEPRSTATDTATDTEQRPSAAPSAQAPGARAPGSPSHDPGAAHTAGPGASRASRGEVPRSGPGTFTASRLSGDSHGSGTVRRYRVEVEEGSGVEPDQAAREVEAILADRRGWIRDPQYAFRLTGQGEVDFTVRIATPTTTDRLCEVTTPELVGETNCRAGHDVVVNLKRWQQGSPQFDGPVAEYRALIVNHEVGHEIGRGHETCPGPGKPAPAMMQQLKGLLGCRSNAWPYDSSGTYLSGPAVP
ncbi:DUF3152 domain-containing protein [Streptomyces sp. WAC06614]|uniref:DUF3152 domain-containing protein n=1 Tax=Streptomyces sp. WAC06614 TaxID=2487416 RepID=UPI000F76C9AB|nr:DUF3152 domain-containing protein [Streptomyces sp. WAC06614]RSS83192.1 DUF3152 domain-containing protein [Streptomyces sp. WAC06614]